MILLDDAVEVGAMSVFRDLSTSVIALTQVIGELDELDKLRPIWHEQAAGLNSPMQAYAWIRACAETMLTADDELYLLTGKTPSPTLAPLVRRRGKQTRLELLGVHELTEPMDFFYPTPSALEPLARAIAQLRMPVLLERILADSPVVTALQHAYRGRGVVLRRPMPSCPWISLDRSWLQPEHHLNAGRRSDLRRARRIAESLGPVRAEILSPTPAELPPLLEEALQVEAASWKGRERSAVIHDPVRGPFYRRYAALACEQGILRLCFLRIGDHVAAMQFAVEYGNAFWLLKIGYDEAFARCSPGSLLMAEIIRYAAAHGLRSYEFLGTPAPWTRVWTLLERPCVSLWAYPAKIQGVTALVMDTATAARRRLSQIMPGWL